MTEKTYLFYELKNQKRSQKLGQISVLFRWFCVKLRGKTKPQQKTGWQTQGGIRRPMDTREKDRHTNNPIFGDVWKTRMVFFFFLNEINVDCFSFFLFFKELDWKFLNANKKNKLNIQKKIFKKFALGKVVRTISSHTVRSQCIWLSVGKWMIWHVTWNFTLNATISLKSKQIFSPL